jgi:SulP family sulfate permease
MHRLYDYDFPTSGCAHIFRPTRFLAPRFDRSTVAADLNAGFVVAIVLIPSAMAYALLAGLPPQVGVYASILPLIGYAFVGRSRVVSVGPVTIVSLMTASTLAPLVAADPAAAPAYAATLALLCAGVLALASWLRLGRFVNILSHSVLSGFLTAVGVIIASSQMKHLIGVPLPRSDIAPVQVWYALTSLHVWSPATLAIGGLTLVLLMRKKEICAALMAAGWIGPSASAHLQRAMPLVAAGLAIAIAAVLDLPRSANLAVVGPLPRLLPEFGLPSLHLEAWRHLLPGAILMSAIGFLECAGVVRGIEAKSGERLDADRELAGLAVANLGASVSGGYPVSGGTIRSVMNFNAGAATPFANAWTAMVILVTLVLFAPLIARLPMAVLAAIVIAASLSIIDFSLLTGDGKRADRIAFLGTALTTILGSPEAGLLAGLAFSLAPTALAALKAGPNAPVVTQVSTHVAPPDDRRSRGTHDGGRLVASG